MTDVIVPNVVYVLCALTSALCAGLLLRTYRRSPGRQKLLLVVATGFIGLAVHSAFLVVDMIFLTSVDLSLARSLVGLVAMASLLFGLIWETR
jgi:hypothetical protein